MGTTPSKQAPCESIPSALEGSDASHVSRLKKHDKHPKIASSPNIWKRSGGSVVPVGEERTLEIELVQDRTALRSKRGDTGRVAQLDLLLMNFLWLTFVKGSVLWRVR